MSIVDCFGSMWQVLKGGVSSVESALSTSLKSSGLDLDAVASAGKVAADAANTAVNSATPIAQSLYKVRGLLALSRTHPHVGIKGCNVDIKGCDVDVKGYDADGVRDSSSELGISLSAPGRRAQQAPIA
eukprot:2960254-Pyramimonas_sp.AAC.1